jgi:uncharacterized protein YecT (DUF1311 family)
MRVRRVVAFAIATLMLATACTVRPDPVRAAERADCSGATTQAELNGCTAAQAKRADRQLNETYQRVLAKYRESGPRRALVDAELQWIRFRDAECRFSASRYNGGSIAPMIYSECVTRLTNARTQALASYMKEP